MATGANLGGVAGVIEGVAGGARTRLHGRGALAREAEGARRVGVVGGSALAFAGAASPVQTAGISWTWKSAGRRGNAK